MKWNEKKIRVAIFISNKTHFENKGFKRQIKTVPNDRKNNPTIGFSNCKHLCAQVGIVKYK